MIVTTRWIDRRCNCIRTIVTDRAIFHFAYSIKTALIEGSQWSHNAIGYVIIVVAILWLAAAGAAGAAVELEP